MLPPREKITWSRKLKKKSRERASKGMRHESAAQVCTTHIWRSPRKLRKNDSQEKCFCQSYNCAVAKVWRIVCESNCIDEPAGENCHTEVYRGSKTACVAQVFLHLARFHHVQPLGGLVPHGAGFCNACVFTSKATGDQKRKQVVSFSETVSEDDQLKLPMFTMLRSRNT